MDNKRTSRLYKVWIDMRNRCNNPNNKGYKRYGARGIKVCDEWQSNYISFYNWAIDNNYKENVKRRFTVDRIDNLKGYSPDNCRLLSIQEQQNNRTNNYWITYKGEKHTVSQWSKILNINVQTIFNRIKKDLPVEKILSKEKLYKNKELVQSGNQN